MNQSLWHITQCITYGYLKKIDKERSGIYPRIFTRIDLIFKAGKGTFDKRPTCTRICGALSDVKATPWKAAHGVAR